jgi:lipoprotein-anchoring transpeptidase ErfK/SrfK
MVETHSFIDIAISTQQLSYIENSRLIITYPVSTAKKGMGEQKGSECTPRGWHNIRAKIGAGQPLHAVFKGRRPTGEVYSAELGGRYPQRDWILTRILWLGGLEPGKNRYGDVDSCWRYIYIHGCPDHLMTGIPDSHGCIRMNNADMLDLFNRVSVGLKVMIHE